MVPAGTVARWARDVVRAAADTLADAVCLVSDEVGPDPGRVLDAFARIQGPEARHVHGHVLGTWPSQAARYAPDVARVPRCGVGSHAGRARSGPSRAGRPPRSLAALWSRVDVVLLPSTGCLPPERTNPDIADVDGRPVPLRDVVLPHTALANVGGLPAVSVPFGFPLAGVPGSVQLLGPAGSDALLLSLAEVLDDSRSST